MAFYVVISVYITLRAHVKSLSKALSSYIKGLCSLQLSGASSQNSSPHHEILIISGYNTGSLTASLDQGVETPRDHLKLQ
jgi:hypothetical protein